MFTRFYNRLPSWTNPLLGALMLSGGISVAVFFHGDGPTDGAWVAFISVLAICVGLAVLWNAYDTHSTRGKKLTSMEKKELCAVAIAHHMVPDPANISEDDRAALERGRDFLISNMMRNESLEYLEWLCWKEAGSLPYSAKG